MQRLFRSSAEDKGRRDGTKETETAKKVARREENSRPGFDESAGPSSSLWRWRSLRERKPELADTPSPPSSDQSEKRTKTNATAMAGMSFVFAFGDNSDGQLGIESWQQGGGGVGFDEDKNSFVCIPTRLSKFGRSRMISLACQADRCYLISENGEFWTTGRSIVDRKLFDDDFDEMGEMKISSSKRYKPRKVESAWPNQNGRFVAAGPDHTAVVLESGSCLTFGSNEFSQLGHGSKGAPASLKLQAPRAVSGLGRLEVSQVACGSYHTLLLTKTGQVFSCGDNSHGCLGISMGTLPANGVNQNEAQQVRALVGLPIQQVAAGERHSLALTISGKVYIWGYNKEQRLGIHKESLSPDDDAVKSLQILATPQRLSIGIEIAFISAGSNHTSLVAADGSIYMMGANESGQCGVNPDQSRVVTKPRRLHVSRNQYFGVSSACGSSHTLVLTQSGECLSLGRNLEGQLGIGHLSQAEHIPQTVKLSHPSNVPLFAYACAAGGNHSMLLTVPILSNKSTTSGAVLLSSAGLSVTNELDAINGRVERQRSQGIVEVPLLRLGSEVRRRDYWNAGLIKFGSSESAERNDLIAFRIMERRKMENSPSAASTPGYDLFKSGITVEEGLSFVSRLNAHTEDLETVLTELGQLLFPVFKNVVRLNSSFLLPGSYKASLDVDGYENFCTGLLAALPQPSNAVTKKFFMDWTDAIKSGLEQITSPPLAMEMKDADQVRFFLIIIHTPMFVSLNFETAFVLQLLFNILTMMPLEGRIEIHDIVTNSYTSGVFSNRLVKHTKEFINYTLNRSTGKSIPTIDPLWNAILFLQLLYHSNEIVQDATRLEEATRRHHKVPIQELEIEILPDKVDPLREWRILKDHIKLSRNSPELYYRSLPFKESPATPRSSIYDNPAKSNMSDKDKAAANADETQPSSDDEERLWRYRPRFALQCTGAIPAFHRCFIAHLNLCPLRLKRDVITAESIEKQQTMFIQGLFRAGMPYFTLIVNRNNLVSDAMTQILAVVNSGPAVLCQPLKVHFVGEEGVDEGGLKREFFRLATSQLFDPDYGVFIYQEDTRVYWFNENSVDSKSEFFLVGCLLGLASYNDVLLDLHFPMALYKKLQDIPVSLPDYAEIDSIKANSLKMIAEFGSDMDQQDAAREFQNMFGEMTFSIERDFFGTSITTPLIENGEQICLSYERRQEFVERSIEYYLTESIKSMFGPFRDGFRVAFSTEIAKALEPEELELILCGVRELDFKGLREGAIYENGYREDDTYIQDFWAVLDEFDIHRKKKFLYFCTGNDRVPIGGLKCLHLRIIKHEGDEDSDRLPSAHTCYNVLLLPRYRNKDKLRRMLTVAVENSEGFGLR